jgi:hypothetical protein
MRSLVKIISAGRLPADPVVIRNLYIRHSVLHCNIFLHCTINFPSRLRGLCKAVKVYIARKDGFHAPAAIMMRGLVICTRLRRRAPRLRLKTGSGFPSYAH